jgi:2-C-methyl-D-erythritol 4-phosphate cytidylyltransferase
MKVGGIILAGGAGVRYGSRTPKQFLKLRGRTLLEHSVAKFKKTADFIVIVVHPEWIKKAEQLFPGGKNGKVLICRGGKTRQLSVYNGLKALAEAGLGSGRNDLAVIHDGARPLFTTKLLRQCVELAKKKGSAVPVLQVASTLCSVKNGKILKYIDRESVRKIQTPQAFHFKKIKKAHDLAYTSGKWDYTDDSRIFERTGKNADILDGEVSNIKITSPSDMALAVQLMKTLPGG